MSRIWEDAFYTETTSNSELRLPVIDRQWKAMRATNTTSSSSSSRGLLLAAVTLFETIANAESENAPSLILEKYRAKYIEAPG